MTSFNIEDAIQLRNRLERCRETYRHEWESVRQRWQDLQYTWRDSQYRNFEPDFQRLIQTHDDVLDDLERQLQSLERAISVTNCLNEKLQDLNNLSTEGSSHQQPLTQFNNLNRSESSSSKEAVSDTDANAKNWENGLLELLQSIKSVIGKTTAIATMSVSMLGLIYGSQSFVQANKMGANFLRSGIEQILISKDVVDLNNKTIGKLSSLPDKIIFRIVEKLSEDAGKSHFSNKDIAELIDQYADNEEKKRRRREEEQKLSV
jgi:hypothetical protein